MKALKLDSSFRPVDIIDSVEALVLCLIGKARAVESYSKEIRSVAASFKLWRDQNQCQYCRNKFSPGKLTIDHVVPKSRGGKNTWQNLVAACKKCNQRKGSRTSKEANMFPIRIPLKPKDSILRSIKKENVSPMWADYLWNFS